MMVPSRTRSSGGETQLRELRSLTILACVGAMAILTAACGGSSTAGTSASATVPAGLSVTSFDASYSAMAQLKSLVAAGERKVAAVLPGPTTPRRYVTYYQPMLTKALHAAGGTASPDNNDKPKGR